MQTHVQPPTELSEGGTHERTISMPPSLAEVSSLTLFSSLSSLTEICLLLWNESSSSSDTASSPGGRVHLHRGPRRIQCVSLAFFFFSFDSLLIELISFPIASPPQLPGVIICRRERRKKGPFTLSSSHGSRKLSPTRSILSIQCEFSVGSSHLFSQLSLTIGTLYNCISVDLELSDQRECL